jgi:hypothetical protein
MDKGAFVSRAEAESTTLKELLERYLEEVTPLKKGAEPETNRLRLMMRHPLARRFVAGLRGVDIARWRDERLWPKQVDLHRRIGYRPDTDTDPVSGNSAVDNAEQSGESQTTAPPPNYSPRRSSL